MIMNSVFAAIILVIVVGSFLFALAGGRSGTRSHARPNRPGPLHWPEHPRLARRPRYIGQGLFYRTRHPAPRHHVQGPSHGPVHPGPSRESGPNHGPGHPGVTHGPGPNHGPGRPGAH